MSMGMDTDMDMDMNDMQREICRKLADKGRVVEAGWMSLRIAVIDPDAPANQLAEMRMAFFAGAQHLFRNIISMLDTGREPTEGDLRRMTAISKELDGFIEDFKRRHGVGIDKTQVQ